MDYRIIDKAHEADINLKNEPFRIRGRMIPMLVNGAWSYTESLYPEEEITSMCFPDENYQYDEMEKEHVFIGAYDGDRCVGIALMREEWFKYMYLDDLKVCAAYRRRGIGRGLIAKAMEVALERNYNGIYTIGQDNNIDACRFYLSAGFEIGGFNNRVYQGTVQEDKADIYFYLN